MRSLLLFLTVIIFPLAASPERILILQDDFEREESSPELEEIGEGWSTNSAGRAKGQKQADLVNGVLHIKRAEVADHSVSLKHDAHFTNGTILLRFMLAPESYLEINVADPKEPSVHAGHLALARIRLNQIEISDLKSGRFNLVHMEARKNKTLTEEQKQVLESSSKYVDVDLTAKEWHALEVKFYYDEVSVKIDGLEVSSHKSPGFVHPNKKLLRIEVDGEAWIDDLKVWATLFSM